MLQALLWGAPVSVYWLMEPETERRSLLLPYILHMETVSQQRDELAVGWFRLVEGNCISHNLLDDIQVTPVPSALNGVPDRTINRAGGCLELFCDFRIEFLCDALQNLRCLIRQDDGASKVLIALNVGRNAQHAEEVGYPNLYILHGLRGRGLNGLCSDVAGEGPDHFDHVRKGISLRIQFLEHLHYFFVHLCLLLYFFLQEFTCYLYYIIYSLLRQIPSEL